MKVIFNSFFVLVLAMGCRAADLNHAAMVRGDAALMDSMAIKSKLTLVFTDDFKRANGTNLGTAWTEAAHYGVVDLRISHHHLRFEIPDGHDIPWGSATLDLTHAAIPGHGLRPGDYFEIGLR